MDFRTTAAGYQYGVRASALIIHAGKLLTYSHDGKYFVPGGAVQVGEHSADAVRREVREELGIGCTVRKLAFVGEHLFTVHDIPNHRIEFHYLVEIDSEAVPITTCEEEHRYPLPGCRSIPWRIIRSNQSFLHMSCRGGMGN